MGDILHALPAITSLRNAHPNWQIDWVVEPRWQALLAVPGTIERGEQMPVVDKLHFAPTKHWRKGPLSPETLGGVNTLRKQLKAGAYDAVLDVQGAMRSSIIARMAGCKRVIGEAAPRETTARLLFSEQVVTHGAHVIEQDIELARAVAGDPLEWTPPMLPVDRGAEAWADSLLASSGTRPIAIINPGAGWGAKVWPVDRYAAVARGLSNRGYRILVNAGPKEEVMADTIVKGTASSAIPLAMGLEQLIAVTRRASLFIAGDTGPLHLACALGRPVIGIFGPTDPSRNGPFGTRFRVLRSPMSKRDHTRRPEPEAGLLTIQPEDVLRATDELLAEAAV